MKLAYYLKHNMFSEIERLMEEYEVPNLLNFAAEQRIYEDDLFELYLGMTDNAGAKRGLSIAMSDSDLRKIPTTKDGHKAYYYKVPTLKYYETYQSGFDEVDINIEE